MEEQRGNGARPGATIRIAAVGDIHCREPIRGQIVADFASIRDEADLVLLAGDLTSLGEPDEAAILADACAPLELPIVAVLGNHDCHAGRHDEIARLLRAAGIELLEGGATVIEMGGHEVGIAGGKGFVGGFGGSHIPDFGEPLMREVYAQTTREVDALDRGLREIAHCPVRIALLHYSPVAETLEGERREIWAFLGTDRLAAPILEHRPDLVLHGHAHAGRLEARIGDIPVYNVSLPVIDRAFWTLEMEVAPRPLTPIR